MSYQVLARKWRPNSFAELVGQEHVVSAISNALDNNRLHHAYLFTGTRGVGKTTIARIFSKSLNCELGLSATPCGKCSTCVEIEQGNFIDMLEIDAASRTKVEDTRELLDNVQYRPSRGRFKVYLIDEVHMLSKHSFNALLKTLEEPPPHVKFLLATTDPQKLPVTILSRCLQFNLKALSRSQISVQLAFILQQEQLECETEALNQLARAAQGSMRDALSLTDQAIAQGNGVVSLSIVTDMLGLMDKNVVLKLLNALLQKHGDEVMQLVESMAMQAADFSQVLAELMSLLHQVALTQLVPEACKLETIAARAIYQLAKGVAPEHIQLLYQIALNGKKDLPYAADPRSGLEMTLLRMLAFSPDNLTLSAKDINALGAQALSHINSEPQTAKPGPAVPNKAPTAEIKPSEIAQSEKQVAASHPEQSVTNQPVVNMAETANEYYPQQDDASDDEQQNLADSAYEQELFAQQQGILQQAQDYGHHPHAQETGEAAEHRADVPIAAEPSAEALLNTTETMIALRKKLQQSQAAMEEKNQAEKKPQRTELPNLASIRQSKEADVKETLVPEKVASEQVVLKPAAPADSPVIEASSFEAGSFEAGSFQPGSFQPGSPQTNSDSDEENSITELDSALMPPWDFDDSPTAFAPVAESDNNASSELSQDRLVESNVSLDAHGHLALDELGEVNLDIPVFLQDKQKVVSATQVDEWSQLIDTMQITALTKQLALHSSFVREGDSVKLTLLQSKVHLDTPSARQQLADALSATLQTKLSLEIVLGHPINTPFAIQQKVNALRKEYAYNVINNDANIRLMQELFAAKVDNSSIVAR